VPFGASQPRSQERTTLIDRLRHDIQQRLEELLAEADKLRRALAVLDPRKRSRLDAKTAKPRPAAKARPAPLAAAKHAPARTRTRAADAKDGAGASTRTAPGETKAKVLAALSGDQALTAGEVAKATGVARPTVSTTLSKLAKTGAIVKAERGYRLPSIDGATPSATEPTATPSTHDA
jgi:DNA-binding transcriptional ArsR family regulator